MGKEVWALTSQLQVRRVRPLNETHLGKDADYTAPPVVPELESRPPSNTPPGKVMLWWLNAR